MVRIMKKNMSALLRRIGSMSLKRMENNVDVIHRETGVSKSFIRADMIACAVKRGVGYLDYRVFGFAQNRDKRARDTYMTMNHNLFLCRKLNDPAAEEDFKDKHRFNTVFHAFTGRDSIFLPDCDADALKRFCQGKKAVFAKVTTSFGGQGIERLTLSGVDDFQALYERLCREKKFLVEDEIVQHPEMERLCPNSVNTLRVVTLLHEGEPHVVYALIRMGNGKNHVDNISSGGMYALLDKDGRISERAFCDKTTAYYEEHPVSGVRFHSFVVPYFSETCELCRSAARLTPRVGYVGWDVAITADGPVLIEGNHLPSYDMCQNSGLNNSKTGSLPWFERVLGVGFFEGSKK